MAEGDTDAEFDSFTLRRSGKLVSHTSETDEQEAGEPPATIKRRPRGKANKDAIESRRMELEYELEKQKLSAEREREKMQHDLKLKQLELEIAKHSGSTTGNSSNLPIKLKLQPFDHQKEDILTYLGEFENISNQTKWTEEIKILQLRSLLTGEAREVSQKTCKTYQDLRKALIDRFGRKASDYFSLLQRIQKNGDTYRGLMSKIELYVSRFCEDRNPVECFQEEFFLSALPIQQAQWIRRNRGSGTVVDAAEDYVLPNHE